MADNGLSETGLPHQHPRTRRPKRALTIKQRLSSLAHFPPLARQVLDVWIFGRIWCRGWLVTDVWISTASILNLCAISIDRYVAVTRPVKYRSIMTARRAKCIVAAVWILSFIICFPPLLPEWAPPPHQEPPGQAGTLAGPSSAARLAAGPAGSVRTRRQLEEGAAEAESAQTTGKPSGPPPPLGRLLLAGGATGAAAHGLGGPAAGKTPAGRASSRLAIVSAETSISSGQSGARTANDEPNSWGGAGGAPKRQLGDNNNSNTSENNKEQTSNRMDAIRGCIIVIEAAKLGADSPPSSGGRPPAAAAAGRDWPPSAGGARYISMAAGERCRLEWAPADVGGAPSGRVAFYEPAGSWVGARPTSLGGVGGGAIETSGAAATKSGAESADRNWARAAPFGAGSGRARAPTAAGGSRFIVSAGQAARKAPRATKTNLEQRAPAGRGRPTGARSATKKEQRRAGRHSVMKSSTGARPGRWPAGGRAEPARPRLPAPQAAAPGGQLAERQASGPLGRLLRKSLRNRSAARPLGPAFGRISIELLTSQMVRLCIATGTRRLKAHKCDLDEPAASARAQPAAPKSSANDNNQKFKANASEQASRFVRSNGFIVLTGNGPPPARQGFILWPGETVEFMLDEGRHHWPGRQRARVPIIGIAATMAPTHQDSGQAGARFESKQEAQEVCGRIRLRCLAGQDKNKTNKVPRIASLTSIMNGPGDNGAANIDYRRKGGKILARAVCAALLGPQAPSRANDRLGSSEAAPLVYISSGLELLLVQFCNGKRPPEADTRTVCTSCGRARDKPRVARRKRELASQGALEILARPEVADNTGQHGWTNGTGNGGFKSGCALFHDKTYVVYSALGSFYIPMLVMVFFYSRIYLVASRAQKAMQRGYMTTKSWPSAGPGGAKGSTGQATGTGSGASGTRTDAGPERVTLRIHRRTEQRRQRSWEQSYQVQADAAAICSSLDQTPTLADRTTDQGTRTDDARSNARDLDDKSVLVRLTAIEQQQALANANLRRARLSLDNLTATTSGASKTAEVVHPGAAGMDAPPVEASKPEAAVVDDEQQPEVAVDTGEWNETLANGTGDRDVESGAVDKTNTGAEQQARNSRRQRQRHGGCRRHEREHRRRVGDGRAAHSRQIVRHKPNRKRRDCNNKLRSQRQGVQTTDNNDSVSSVQIMISAYEDTDGGSQVSTETSKSWADGIQRPASGPIFVAVTPPPDERACETVRLAEPARSERSQSVTIVPGGLVQPDEPNGTNLTDLQAHQLVPGRPDRSHSYGPTPTILVNWDQEAQVANSRLAAPDDDQTMQSLSSATSSGRNQAGANSHAGSGLSLMANLPNAANQVRKQSMMLLTSLTIRSSQTLRRLSTAAAHPVESLLRHRSRSRQSGELGDNNDEHSDTLSSGSSRPDNGSAATGARRHRRKKKKKKDKKGRASMGMAHGARSPALASGPKKTLDDYLMAVAGIDTSSDEYYQDDDDDDDGQDDESLSDESLRLSVMLTREHLLVPSIMIGSAGDKTNRPRISDSEESNVGVDVATCTNDEPGANDNNVGPDSSDNAGQLVTVAQLATGGQLADASGHNESTTNMSVCNGPSNSKFVLSSSRSAVGDQNQGAHTGESPRPTSALLLPGLHRKGGLYESATSRASLEATPSARIEDPALGKVKLIQSTVGKSQQRTGVRRRGAKRTSRWHAKRLRAETKAAKTVAIIVGGFIFCWLPFFTAYLSRAIICETPDCVPQSWLSLFIWLGYLNSAINPVIYGLFSADFRHAFKNIVCRCRLRGGADDTVVVSVLVDSIIKSIL